MRIPLCLALSAVMALVGGPARAVKISQLYPYVVDASATSTGLGLSAKDYMTAVDASGPLLVGPHGATIRLATVPGSASESPNVVNARNQVGGQALYLQNGAITSHVTITGKNGVGITDLGTLPGGTVAYAYGINASGKLTGLATVPSALGYHGFVTAANGKQLRDLGTLTGATNLSVFAFGINTAGQVAGASQIGPTTNSVYHAVLTAANGGAMRDIQTLAGALQTIGRGVNDAGVVVGDLFLGSSVVHAFITGADGADMRDIGTLGGTATGYGVNQDGNVVGDSQVADGSTHAFITGNNGANMRDLNAVVVGVHPLFVHAYAINDKGHVLALDDNDQAYILCEKQGCF